MGDIHPSNSPQIISNPNIITSKQKWSKHNYCGNSMPSTHKEAEIILNVEIKLLDQF